MKASPSHYSMRENAFPNGIPSAESLLDRGQSRRDAIFNGATNEKGSMRDQTGTQGPTRMPVSSEPSKLPSMAVLRSCPKKC